MVKTAFGLFINDFMPIFHFLNPAIHFSSLSYVLKIILIHHLCYFPPIFTKVIYEWPLQINMEAYLYFQCLKPTQKLQNNVVIYVV